MKKITLLCVFLLLLTGCSVKPAIESEKPPLSPETPTVRPTDDAPAPTPSLIPTEPSAPPARTPGPFESPPLENTAPVEDMTLENLTLADFPTELFDPLVVTEGTQPLYLLAELPEQDTWLYGIHLPQKEQGLILRLGETWQYLNIAYLMPDAVLPQLAYGDFDGDLELELSLLLHTRDGNASSIWDLWIIELGDHLWSIHSFGREDYIGILDSAVTSVYDAESSTITLSADEVTLTLPAEGSVSQGIYFGAWVNFFLTSDSIRATFDGTLTASDPGAAPIVTVSADVIYTGSVFGLANFSLAPIS